MGVGSFINPYDFNHYQAHCLTFSASSCRYFEKAKKNSKTSPFALTSPKPELYNFLGWPEAPVFHIFKKPECTTVNKIALRLVKCLESWCYQKNLHGLSLSNVNKKWKIFFKLCGLLAIYELYVTVLRPRFSEMKCIERSINLYSHDNAGASEQSHSMTLHSKNWEWVTPFSATDRRFPATF